MTRSITDSLLDVLADAGARDVFGIVGDVINPFVDGVIRDSRFRWFTVRHEEHAPVSRRVQAQHLPRSLGRNTLSGQLSSQGGVLARSDAALLKAVVVHVSDVGDDQEPQPDSEPDAGGQPDAGTGAEVVPDDTSTSGPDLSTGETTLPTDSDPSGSDTQAPSTSGGSSGGCTGGPQDPSWLFALLGLALVFRSRRRAL